MESGGEKWRLQESGDELGEEVRVAGTWYCE